MKILKILKNGGMKKKFKVSETSFVICIVEISNIQMILRIYLKMRKLIPYGRQSISKDDINSVIKALRSDFLTTGPLTKNLKQNLKVT